MTEIIKIQGFKFRKIDKSNVEVMRGRFSMLDSVISRMYSSCNIW